MNGSVFKDKLVDLPTHFYQKRIHHNKLYLTKISFIFIRKTYLYLSMCLLGIERGISKNEFSTIYASAVKENIKTPFNDF